VLVASNKIYVGHRNNKVCFVSSAPCQSDKFDTLEVVCPPEVTDLRDVSQNYRIWRDQLLPKDAPLEISELRIALVGVYKIPCGIATYSEALWTEQKELVKEAHIFAEVADVPAEEGVTRCWKRGQPLDILIKKINDYKPDIVFVQHEFGIFPDARYWLSFLSAMQKYRTVVTLHSVFRHADKTICEAAIPEIIVHTNLARNVLVKEKKVPGDVTVFPHGCFPPENPEKLWNRYFTKHTVMQFGFGFRYKGWERSIEAIHKLRNKFPDIFFTGLFSESAAGAQAHDELFHELLGQIEKLHLHNHVSIIRGFQSDETLQTYLRTNRVAIFPYTNHPEHVVFGSTGAARVAMTQGVPVIVSDVPLFHDLEGICPRTASVDDICMEITNFFDEKKAKEQVAKQNKFLTDNSWARVAQRQLEKYSRPQEKS
jgi:glycosyltransferase involved in cell wall biosynthesis